MAVMEYCSPIGTPCRTTPSYVRPLPFFPVDSQDLEFSYRPDMPHLRLPGRSPLPRLLPATPMCRDMIKYRSSTILINGNSTKNTTGVLLSPVARITPATMLYRNTVGIPINIMKNIVMRPVNDVGGRLHPYQNVPAQDRRHHGHDDGKGKSQPGQYIFAHAHIIPAPNLWDTGCNHCRHPCRNR